LLDVFDNGKPLSRAEANDLAMSYTDAPLKDEQLKAASKRDIVIRMLQNLLRIAQHQESTADSLRYLDLIVALAPDAPLERYSRALLRLRAGDQPGAKQDLKWLLDTQPAEIDLERLMELYHSL
jgi:regulator of sirC expression with transglutaminase-like and TPR domain